MYHSTRQYRNNCHSKHEMKYIKMAPHQNSRMNKLHILQKASMKQYHAKKNACQIIYVAHKKRWREQRCQLRNSNEILLYTASLRLCYA